MGAMVYELIAGGRVVVRTIRTNPTTSSAVYPNPYYTNTTTTKNNNIPILSHSSPFAFMHVNFFPFCILYTR